MITRSPRYVEANVSHPSSEEQHHVNPPHYKSHPSGVECIQITRHFNNNLGNVIKYVWRAGKKENNSTRQDLKKALYYLKDEIKRVSSSEPS